MPRPGRNWVQRKCDQLGENCDHMLGHLKQLHDIYTVGQEGDGGQQTIDPDTGIMAILPQYPEHVEIIENLTSVVIMLQKTIQQFKRERV